MTDYLKRAVKFLAVYGIFQLFADPVFAGAVITYHGRLLDPQGTPVEASNVTFNIRILSPALAGSCLLLEEQRTLNLQSSAGVFVIPIGDGLGTRTSNDPGFQIESILSNTLGTTFSKPSGWGSGQYFCNSGTSYSPAVLDGRQLAVSFRVAGGAWQQLPNMDITFVPFAVSSYDAQNIGGVPAQNVLRVDGGVATSFSVAEFSELKKLIDGTSTSFSSGAGSSGTVTEVTAGTGLTTTAGSTLSGGSIATMGALNLTNTGVIAGSYGTASSVPVFTVDAQGRLSSVTATTISGVAPGGTASGDLSGTYPSPTVERIKGQVVAATATADGEVLRFNGTQWWPGSVRLSELASSTGVPGSAINATSCLPNQTLNWSSLLDKFECQNIASLDAGVLTTGTVAAARLPANATRWQDGAAGILYYSGGNVGVGTAAPAAQFAVNDSILSTASVGIKNQTGLPTVLVSSVAAPASSSAKTTAATFLNQPTLTVSGTSGHNGITTEVVIPDSNTYSVGVIRGAYTSAVNSGSGVVANILGSYHIGSNTGQAANVYGLMGASSNSGNLTADLFGANYTNLNSGTIAGAQVGWGSSVTNSSGGSVQKQWGINSSLIQNATGTLTEQMGVRTVAGNSAAGTVTDQYAVFSSANNSGSGTVVNSTGSFSRAYNASTGSVTNAYGSVAQIYNDSTGAITTAYGIYSDIYNPAGTITTGYGVYVGSIAATNKFSVYASDHTAKSFFAGSVGIGTDEPKAALEVIGGVKMGTQALCDAASEGTQRYNASTKMMEFCNGTFWGDMSPSGTQCGFKSNGMVKNCQGFDLSANACPPGYTYTKLVFEDIAAGSVPQYWTCLKN